MSPRRHAAGTAALATVFLGAGLLAGCARAARPTAVAQAWRWDLPPGFPEPRVPADNPMSEAKFQLGRHLFYDERLSGNGTQACASCHLQHLAFTDGRAVAVGSTGESTARGAMSIVNSGYYATLTWANPSLCNLETQAQVPLFADNVGIELGVNDENKAVVLARFRDDPDYRRLFRAAFPGEADPFDFDHIVKALACFERAVISGDSRYDQAMRGQGRLTDAEERGRALFAGERGQCSQCHSGFNFSDQTIHAGSARSATPFHNTGLYNLDGKGAYPDDNPGLIGTMPQAENMGRFRAPTLRNIALTAPYMHDGSIATLTGVLDSYAGHGRGIEHGPERGDGRASPLKDPRLDRIRLDEQDKADIVAFLKTLTDDALIADPRFSDPFERVGSR